MRISAVNTYQYSFKGLFGRKQTENPDYIIRGQGGKILKYEMKDDMLFVKGKPYSGIVRFDYTNGKKEHRNYENGRAVSSDLYGDGVAKVFYAYKPLESGKVATQIIKEGDDGLEAIIQN